MPLPRNCCRPLTRSSKEHLTSRPESQAEPSPPCSEAPLLRQKRLANSLPRQREVIQLFAEGRSMKEIADILTISLRTVAAHKYQIMDLLEIKTNAELYRYAVKHKIVTV